MPELSKTVIELSKDGYPELEEKKAMILKVLAEEEEKFNKTIDQGLAILYFLARMPSSCTIPTDSR